jgi:hypothetical protein
MEVSPSARMMPEDARENEACQQMLSQNTESSNIQSVTFNTFNFARTNHVSVNTGTTYMVYNNQNIANGAARSSDNIHAMECRFVPPNSAHMIECPAGSSGTTGMIENGQGDAGSSDSAQLKDRGVPLMIENGETHAQLELSNSEMPFEFGQQKMVHTRYTVGLCLSIICVSFWALVWAISVTSIITRPDIIPAVHLFVMMCAGWMSNFMAKHMLGCTDKGRDPQDEKKVPHANFEGYMTITRVKHVKCFRICMVIPLCFALCNTIAQSDLSISFVSTVGTVYRFCDAVYMWGFCLYMGEMCMLMLCLLVMISVLRIIRTYWKLCLALLWIRIIRRYYKFHFVLFIVWFIAWCLDLVDFACAWGHCEPLVSAARDLVCLRTGQFCPPAPQEEPMWELVSLVYDAFTSVQSLLHPLKGFGHIFEGIYHCAFNNDA